MRYYTADKYARANAFRMQRLVCDRDPILKTLMIIKSFGSTG